MSYVNVLTQIYLFLHLRFPPPGSSHNSVCARVQSGAVKDLREYGSAISSSRGTAANHFQFLSIFCSFSFA